MERFRDRAEAGRKLAEAVRPHVHEGEQPIVLALPRGGVPVGQEVANRLKAPLDVWIVRKVGVPWQPELGVGGAVAEGGYVCLNASLLRHLHLTETEFIPLVESTRREVEERKRTLRSGRPSPDLRGRTVIVVDDGIATGSVALAAVRSIRRQSPKGIILAVPVAGVDDLATLKGEVDRIVCLLAPEELFAVGTWYGDFGQVSDEAVLGILERAARQVGEPPRQSSGRARPGARA
jgi:predicted phosphoribosyltransferase